MTDLPIDNYVAVVISGDELEAYITFENVNDSFTCSVDQLENLLKNNRVLYGIHNEKLTEIVKNVKAFFAVQTLVARGDAPEHGKDGYISYNFELDNNSRSPALLGDGTVDYKEVTVINNVRKGELIASRVPATEGTDGRAVTGEVLAARKGKEHRFKIGRDVVADKDHMLLYAAIDGVVVKTERDKINVFPVYEVNGDLDFNIGNIDFVGSVVIRGNVLSGFKIKASGDIRITGGVEAAELTADGSIEISDGILGQHKGFVKAGRNIKCSFIQDANVEAGEDVVISQSIMHSAVRAGKNVICKGAKGLIVGGIIQAGEQVHARTIGNTMSTNTIVEVGVLPELRNELIQMRGSLKTNIDNLDKTEKALMLLDQLAAAGQLSADKLAMRIKLNHTKKQAWEEQAQMKERILEIEASLEDTEKARVEVLSTVYSGTKIVIGRYVKFIKDTISRVYFVISEGDVGMRSKN